MKKILAKLYNGDLSVKLPEIIKEGLTDFTTDEYDNGIEDGEQLTGYSIDFGDADESFLYNSEFERDEDVKLVKEIL